MPIRPIEVSTFANIPSFVPFGVEYFTQDTADLYVGTGASSGPAVVAVNGGSGGSVSSVGAAVPVEFSIAGSPITSAGTLTIGKVNQNANTIWAGPTSGGAGAPIFRGAVLADLPNSNAPASTFPIAVTSLSAFGDSITLGFGIPQPSKTVPSSQCFAQLFAGLTGVTLTTNIAASGAGLTVLPQIAFQVYSLSPTTNAGSIGILGANDIGFVTTTVANQTVFQNAIMAMVTWLSVPASGKVLDASITRVGTWTPLSQFGLSGHYSSTPGDTATATVSGTSAYVAGWLGGTGYGSLTISVDGVSQGTFNPVPTGNTVGSSQVIPYCFRVSGFSSGSHAVKVTVNGSAFVAVQWMAGNGAVSPPTAIIGNTIPFTGNSAAVISTMDALISNATSALVTDGLNTFLVNSSAAMSLTASPAVYQADGIHPNMYGHAVLAKTFYESFVPAPVFPATSGKNGDALAQILKTPGLTPAFVGGTLEALFNFWATKDTAGGFASIDSNGNLFIKGLNRLQAYNAVSVVANGIPSEYASVNLATQTTNTGATTLYAVPTAGAGMYRASVYAVISQAASTTSTLPDTKIVYTDQDSGAVITLPVTLSNTTNTTTTSASSSVLINAKASTNIQYSIGQGTSYASAGATPMQFAYHGILEYLG